MIGVECTSKPRLGPGEQLEPACQAWERVIVRILADLGDNADPSLGGGSGDLDKVVGHTRRLAKAGKADIVLDACRPGVQGCGVALELAVDLVQNLGSWLVGDPVVVGRYGALEHTNPVGVQVRHCGEVLRVPERVLLEPDLQIAVNNWHKVDRLATGEAEIEEEVQVLLAEDSLGQVGVGPEQLLEVNLRVLIEVGIRDPLGVGAVSLLGPGNEHLDPGHERHIEPPAELGPLLVPDV